MGNAATTDRHETAGEAPGRETLLLPGYRLSWATRSGYDLPGHEAQSRAIGLVQHLDRVARLPERIDIRLLAGAAAPSEYAPGDIGLRDGATVIAGEWVATADLLFTDGSSLSRAIAVSLPWSELERRLTRLIRTYMVEGCARDTFAAWTRGLTDRELRERLGLSAQAAEQTATA